MRTMNKTIHCVDMKNEIQARLFARRRRMTTAQFMADVEEGLNASKTPIAEFWRRARTGSVSKKRGRVAV